MYCARARPWPQEGDDLVRSEFGARGEGHPRAIIVRRKRVVADPTIGDGWQTGVGKSPSVRSIQASVQWTERIMRKIDSAYS
jgi:hypothetical protein